MSGKSEGTGLVDDEGKVVPTIEECLKTCDAKILAQANQPDVIEYVSCEEYKRREAVLHLRHLNDGMGCPTEGVGTNCNLEQLLKAYVTAEKMIDDIIADGPCRIAEEIEKQRAKIRRVK